MQWWDNFLALQSLHKKMIADFATANAVQITYQYQSNASMGQALQLAKRSNQQPDISTTTGLGVPVPQLIDDGWFQPMDLPADVKQRLSGDLYDGINMFDGKVYSFPLFAFRQHNSSLFYNSDMLSKLDIAPPTTFDEFRTACTKAKKLGDNVAGWVAGLNAPSNPYSGVLEGLAQAAGFPGYLGLEFATGTYNYSHEAYIAVFELFEGIVKDKAAFSGATTTLGDPSRGRWVAGAGVFFFDGPWQVGALKQNYPQFLSKAKLAGKVAGLMTLEAGQTAVNYRPPSNATLFLAKSSAHTKLADKLLAEFTTDSYYKGVAGAMDQPPRDLTVVAKSPDAAPLYKELCAGYLKQVYSSPSANIKNPEVYKVAAQTKPITNQVGDIFRSMVADESYNWRKALTTLTSQSNQGLDSAIAAAKKAGAKVSRDDYVFGNWNPAADYTRAMYKSA
ncbi:hypothetical protein GCM10011575_30760 [Microlunatus endophyticus]|uniref:Extracellular solute-binding protein n=2 Tax=Microlunatus endophyticus TaxID=1716077 RepID=A0A917SBZ2_9ACTN|nr:hypothetical protein GCM10011575_30760 [Microlunatus endophyticus]